MQGFAPYGESGSDKSDGTSRAVSSIRPLSSGPKEHANSREMTEAPGFSARAEGESVQAAAQQSTLWDQRGADLAARSILIVEDHALLAHTLLLGLAGRGLTARAARPGGAEAVIEQATYLRPVLVLLDLDLGGVDGLDLLPALRALGARVLVVTAERDESRLAAAIALGAYGWVSKTEPFERLLEAVEMILEGRPLLTRAGLQQLATTGRERLEEDRDLKDRMALLTAREHEVLRALEEGHSAQDIARQLVVSIGTVRSHIRAILTKLGVSTQLAAVALARRVDRAGSPAAAGHHAPAT